MQVLEPPSTSQIYFTPDNYARGFLFSTRPTALAPQGRFRVNQKAGHEVAQTFKDTHFMIDSQMLENQDDGHFYGHGLDALLEGYRKKSHGVIEKIYGPFYYPDNSGDYWYEFGMKLRDSGATAALQKYGSKSWNPFAVSPHLWDYPELGQDPLNLMKARGVGVALVMKGAFGDQAIITRLCKGSSDICYSDKGLGAVLKQECSAGCQCQICKNEDQRLMNLITSYIGKSGSSLSNNLDPQNSNNNNPNLELQQKVLDPLVPTRESQLAITEAKSKEALTLELEELKRKIKEEAEKEYKDEIETLREESKLNNLNKIFTREIITDDNVRNAILEKHKKLSLTEVKNLVSIVEDFKTPYETHIRAKLKAEVERPDNENDNEGEESGDNPDASKKAKTVETTTTVTNKKGKSGSELRPEPKHPLPKEELDSNSSVGKSGAASGSNSLKELRSSLTGRIL
jgi:hypothetical protein